MRVSFIGSTGTGCTLERRQNHTAAAAEKASAPTVRASAQPQSRDCNTPREKADKLITTSSAPRRSGNGPDFTRLVSGSERMPVIHDNTASTGAMKNAARQLDWRMSNAPTVGPATPPTEASTL